MKRAGAVLVAVAMVAAAFLVRDRVAGDDTASGGEGGDQRGLLCPDDLAETCRAVGGPVRTEAAGATADRLIEASDSAELGAEAWVVPAVWARMVIDERARLDREPVFEVTAPVASTPVVQLVWRDVADRLAGECGAAEGESPGWRCVAQRAGDRQVRVGAPPIDSAIGLPVAAAQVAFLLARPDYAANDFGPELRTLVRGLASGQVVDPVRTMRSRGPGELAVVGTVAADTQQLSSNFGSLIPFAQPETVELVVLHPRDRSAGPTDRIADAFETAGWNAPDGGPDNLPSDGSVLAAVRTLWKENQR